MKELNKDLNGRFRAPDSRIKIATLLFLLLVIISSPYAMAQENRNKNLLTLEQCHELAMKNYPAVKRYKLIQQTKALTISNANKGYIPQISVYGESSYQNKTSAYPEVMKKSYEQAGLHIAGLNKDQYKVGINVNQVIWDGGNIESKKKIAQAQSTVNTAQSDDEIYQIRKRVNDLFFGILLVSDKIKEIESSQRLLQANIARIERSVTEGVALPSSLDELEVQRLSNKQRLITLRSQQDAYLAILGLFIHKNIKNTDELVQPNSSSIKLLGEQHLMTHPKMRYLDSRIYMNNMMRKQTQVAIRPQVSLYANGYYGNPGFDMFGDMMNDKWSTNLKVGLKMSWNIGALYTYKKNIKKIEVESRKIEVEKDIFLFNTKIGNQQESQDIIQKKNLLREDDKIIVLRDRIVKRAEIQFQQGVILASDFLREITAHEVASINKSTHEIELLSTIYQQKQTLNGYEK